MTVSVRTRVAIAAQMALDDLRATGESDGATAMAVNDGVLVVVALGEGAQNLRKALEEAAEAEDLDEHEGPG